MLLPFALTLCPADLEKFYLSLSPPASTPPDLVDPTPAPLCSSNTDPAPTLLIHIFPPNVEFGLGIEEALPYTSDTAHAPYPPHVEPSIDTLAATARAMAE